MKIRRSILVTGKIGSGKTSVADYLSNEFHIPVVSFGAMVKSRATQTMDSWTRENLQDLGYEMFVSLGAANLTEKSITNSGQGNAENIIFDGVRHELVLLEIKRKSERIFTIYLKGDGNVRFSRYKSKHALEQLSFSNFLKIDNHPIESGIERLERQADLVIDSSLPLENVLSMAKDALSSLL